MKRRVSPRFSAAVSARAAARRAWLVVDVALGGVQQHLDAREALRDGVVDLARDALALGEGAGLAARGRELLAGREQVEDERLALAGLLPTWPGTPRPR